MKKKIVPYEEYCLPCKGFGVRPRDMMIIDGRDYFNERKSKRRYPSEVFSIVGGKRKHLRHVKSALSIIDLREKNASYFK